MDTSVEVNGYALVRNAVPHDLLAEVRDELLRLAGTLGLPPEEGKSVDTAWNWFKAHDRDSGRLLYNGFKRLLSVSRLATCQEVCDVLHTYACMRHPCIVDINCRIDTNSEEKYLFDWHQDYWFSVSSQQAVVAWIPLTSIDAGTGGLDIIGNDVTGGKVFETKSGSTYNSYADAVKLAETLPADNPVAMLPAEGDMLLFRFNVLHRSRPVASAVRSRFTVQVRYADFKDKEFRARDFKPGTVTPGVVDYLKK